MIHKIAADIVVAVHLLWIMFLIFGAFWGTKNRRVGIVHFTGLVFAVIIEGFDLYCPLTHLEAYLRSRHDPALSYSGSFIIRYMEKIIYMEVSRGLVFFLTAALFAVNARLYFGRRK